MDKQTTAKQKLVVILGPTACGKTALSLQVAQRFDGEIVSGDSMQIYRGLDIGTAKIRPQEMQGVPHHLLDIRDPADGFSVAEFRTLASVAISDIAARGRLPLLVGGTGLYIGSLLFPYNFPAQTESDAKLRQALRERLAAEGAAALHDYLAQVDPEAAARIHVNDSFRLLRALEVFESSGRPISEWQRESPPPPPYDAILIGLDLPRELLYQRIEQRVDEMMEQGLEQEVRALLTAGTDPQCPAMQGLGYRQLAAWLHGETTREQAVELIKRDTRRFAKRQLTWFRRYEQIHWFYPDRYRQEGALAQEVCALIADRLKEDRHEAAWSSGTVS